MDERLADLARRHGISTSFSDVWGEVRHASEDSLRRLLRAMGVDPRAAAEPPASPLPPVRVLYDDEARWIVKIAAPTALRAAPLQWQIETEHGELRQGEFVPDSLPCEDGESLLCLEQVLPAGYHQLRLLNAMDGSSAPLARCLLIVAPRRAYLPQSLAADDTGPGRVWGLSVQLYSLRSERNWGIGDFTDLLELVESAASLGAALVGVNPLHALFAHDPERASPYSPSSRLFLNTLYLDVEAVAEYRECEPARMLVRSAAFQQRLRALRSTGLVDYAGVAAAKREVLALLFEHFVRAHRDAQSPRGAAFDAWCRERGASLRQMALFEALQAHFHAADPQCWGWPVWPQAYRRPDGAAVAEFASANAPRIDFHAWLQWLADRQLAAVGRRSYELALQVGLYADLAVSIDRAGADAWSHQALYAVEASIGAPPDAYSLRGQDWGLPPPVPRRLRESAYAPFIATLRANMRHAGALRIDHVMALARLYWVPQGLPADAGTYVEYPFEELLAILVLESHRNRCLVVGEDLGTVPEDLRERLAAAGVLSYRLLYFERSREGGFAPPADYPAQSLAAIGTHDLPPLAGWWEGRDLLLRDALGLFPDAPMRDRQIVERAQDRARLLLSLEREDLLPEGATVNPVSIPEMTAPLSLAVHGYLARSQAQLVVAQLEDVLGAADPVNVPGTTSEHPNWRRKLPPLNASLGRDERLEAVAGVFARARPRRRLAGGRKPQAAIPRATYRVQLNRDFRFEHARAIVPYLARLGVSHLYCSPFLRARPGSSHGYDVVDHNQINPEIGSREDLEHLVDVLRQHGMGLIVDVVPNHMGVMAADNGWWMDVLENGRSSRYARYFDIDWQSAEPLLAGRVLLPLLGDQYGEVLERGELKLVFEPEAGSFALRYHEHRLPLDPATYAVLLERALATGGPAALPAESRAALESVAAAFGHLPSRDNPDSAARAERQRDKEIHKTTLARLAREQPALADAIDVMARDVNGDPADRSTFGALDALIDAQAYRLAFWRVAGDEINYRRFFDISELAALRMEEPEVFEATHRLILELVAAGKVDGLRIDHPDGLLDPAGYFRRLQQTYAQRIGAQVEPEDRPLYVVAEKIVAPHEQLPEWTVHGTTGYRFCNVVTGLLVDSAARMRLDRAWRAFAGDEAESFEALAYRGRRLVMATSLAGELTVLAGALLRLARADRRTRDFTLNTLRQALAQVVASFPVYRTYIGDTPAVIDRRFIDWAVGAARRRSRAADPNALAFVHDVLLGQTPPQAAEGLRAGYLDFARRLQQFTAPVCARGIEDTAFYLHHRLVALNEVGGDPEVFGIRASAFHGASRDRAARWPHTMLTTSTHDTKRSEDVRARIAVISERPAAWRLAVRRWSRMNRSHRRLIDGAPAPSRNDEYLLYQTLLGTLPTAPLDEAALAAYRERILQYMLKAVREGKRHSSWITPDESYESALTAFVGGLLGRVQGNLFLEDLRQTVGLHAWFGALNSLSVTVLKLTSPGVPDIYQGQQMMDLSLVDPDNRRPVDHAAHEDALHALAPLAEAADPAAAVASLLADPGDGRAKLWATWRTLQLRREQPELFEQGDYRPLGVRGARAHNAIAYARRFGPQVLVVAAGRLYAGPGVDAGTPPVGRHWSDGVVELDGLPARLTLRNVLTGEVLQPVEGRLPLAMVFASWPVAVLHGEARA